MSPLIHGLLAWLLGYALLSDVQDRRLVVIAGVAPDLDGVFVLFNEALFQSYHHTFGHSYVFGLPVAMAAVALARERWKTGAVALGAFSLHLLGDLVGSDWAIAPLYPISGATLSPQGVLSPEVIYGIIDPVVAVAALAVAGLIMYFREVSPVEFVSVRLDKWFVGRFVFPLKHRCGLCARRALARCGSCGRGVCARHLRGFLRTRCTECPAVPGRD